MAIEMVTLPSEAIADLRWALAHGLHAVAEVKRTRVEATGDTPCTGPIDSAPHDGDLSRFAQALIWLDLAEPAEAVA